MQTWGPGKLGDDLSGFRKKQKKKLNAKEISKKRPNLGLFKKYYMPKQI